MIRPLLSILKSIFVVALLADSTNITDLFPDVTTIHFEETEGVLVDRSSIDLAQTPPPATSVVHARWDQLQRFVLLDQDSPSLAPDSTSIAIMALPFLAEDAYTGSDLFVRLSLYLWDRSFLI
jgi:hypothetical protein